MSGRITEAELAEVLANTGGRHHRAFRESNGADPEWAMWYAADIQSRVWDGLEPLPTRGELVYLLVGAERAFRESGLPAGDWPASYARFILDNLAGGT